MRTATVTWASYNNYGTLLQAYALQKAVEQLGHDNVIISDRLILQEWKKTRPAIPVEDVQAVSGPNRIAARMKRLVAHPSRIPRMILMRTNRKAYEVPYNGSQLACEDFRQKELHILEGQTMATLPELNDQFDAFICGSDQVWSVHEGIFNPYYYLEFVSKKKISYATSLGSDQIPQETAHTIKKLLADYEAISVRESISAKQLSVVTERNVEWVADPTLLHDKAFWEAFTRGIQRPKGRYLLCYFLEDKTWYFEYARKMAKKLKLKILLIPNKWEYLSSEYVSRAGVGPKEFVSLFQHAEFVLTDSYHGSIFSTIFQKRFLYLLRFEMDDPKSQNIRVRSLFDHLMLNDIIVFRDHTPDNPVQIDYSLINERIDIMRERSWNYLVKNLL